MSTPIPTIDHARKIRDYLRTYGITKGLGEPVPGKMCIEALVCHVMGLPHGDEPTCVGSEVNKFKIGLNDKPWSTPFTRAKGMERLGIAQLGSDVIDQKEFKDALWLALGQKISPLIFRYFATKTKNNIALLKHADTMEKVATLEEARSKQREYANVNANVNANAYAYGYGYGYDCAYGYGYDCAYGYDYDLWFTKVANIGVDVLISLNSPGCQWLYLCDEPTVQAQDEPKQEGK
jgi:hypothetical protein